MWEEKKLSVCTSSDVWIVGEDSPSKKNILKSKKIFLCLRF